MPKHPVTPFHARAKERAEIVLTPDELREKIATLKAEALTSIESAKVILRVHNQTRKLCRSAIAHIREANLAADMVEEYCRKLEQMR